MSEFVRGLKCRLCGKAYPKEPLNFCTEDFGPLEVDYDYDAVKESLGRGKIELRPETMWRLRELLPLDGEPTVGAQVGGTPLLRADRLAEALGVERLWIKNDAVNFPTLSFKDRVVAVALSKAREFGFEAVGCASTGNLANSVAANAAASGFPAYILIPDNLEKSKIIGTQIFGATVVPVRGNYDDVNRLCSEIAGRHRIAFVNVNLRPFYGEQATGCNPISAAVKAGTREITPVKPDTIAKSLAIGNPADGYFATGVIAETGGWSEDVSDQEIVESIRLLAETEGIFTETAGGTTLAVTKKLLAQGHLKANDRIVVAITGNGLK